MEVKVFTLDELNKAQFRTAYGWAGGGSYGGKKGRGKDKQKRKRRGSGETLYQYPGLPKGYKTWHQYESEHGELTLKDIEQLKKRVLAEKSIPIEEPFEKSRIIGAKDKKKRKSHGKYWDNPNNYVHRVPKSVMEATVHQAAKDWDMPKSQVRKILKDRLAQKQLKYFDKE